MRRHLLTIVLMTAAAATPVLGAPNKIVRHMGGIENQFIVVLAPDTPTASVEGLVQSLAATYGLSVKTIWKDALHGFLCTGSANAIDRLTDDPRVEYAEQDFISAFHNPFLSGTVSTWLNGNYLWFLDRLDEPSWSLRDSTYDRCPEGTGVYAYVIDRGVWAGHAEFDMPSRVVTALDFSDDRGFSDPQWGTDNTSGCYNSVYQSSAWHGTAVASNLAGTNVGASRANVVSLKVITCDGRWHAADYLDAVNWIAGPSNPYRSQPGVINLSGGIPPWNGNFRAFGDAASGAVTATNMPFFSAADNFTTDSCQFSPNDRAYTNVNHSGKIFVVAGTSVTTDPNDPNDYRWQEWNSDGTPKIGQDSGSNSGACVSAYAPAVSIYSARLTASTAYDWANGTSFSAPLTAGIAARYIQQQRSQTGTTPGYLAIYNFLLGLATTPVQHTTTAPNYFYCVYPFATDDRFYFLPYVTNPGVCPQGYSGPYIFYSASNTSNAGMIYWGATCP